MVLFSRSSLSYFVTLRKLFYSTLLYEVIVLVYFTHVSPVWATTDEVKKVHFRIHVPEIINHHIHTKMVFIHEDDGKDLFEEHPYKQPVHHPFNEETYLENWSSWNNNGHIGGHHRSKLHKQNYLNGHKHPPRELENGVYMKDGQGEDIVGFTYPPQYLEEMPHNDINNIEHYMEDSYRHGLHSESGHLITNDHDDFYDANQEEADLTEHDYYHDENDNRDVHSHHHYDKEIGYEDRAGKHANHRKYFVIRMIPR